MGDPTATLTTIEFNRSTPRPPAVEEVKNTKFIETSHPYPENYKNWNMEHQIKSPECVRSATPSCSNITEHSDCLDGFPNPSPPSPHKSAQSLLCLLEDIQGVSVFQQFLKQEGQDTRLLSFWFVCRGIKKHDPNDRDGLFKLINVAFDRKIKRISAISAETKDEIKQRLSSGDIDDTIFDAAQREVEAYITTTYSNFLKSDLYIQHLSSWQNECPVEKESHAPSEPSNLLSTVHEDSELQITEKPIPLTKENLLEWNKISSVTRSEGSASGDFPMHLSKPKKVQVPSECIQVSNSAYKNVITMKEFHAMQVGKLNKVIEKWIKEGKRDALEKVENSKPDGLSRNTCKAIHAPAFDLGFVCDPAEDNVDDILNQHVDRVFKDHDTYSTDSAMFDYASDTNMPSNYKSHCSSTANSDLIDSQRSRDYPKRYSSKKLSAMADSNSSVFDSGISLACESEPSYPKATYGLETRKISHAKKEHMWRNSSTVPVLSRSSRKAVVCNSSQNGNQEVGCSQWSAISTQIAINCGHCDHPHSKLKNVACGRNSHDVFRMKISKGYDSYEDGMCHKKMSGKLYPGSGYKTSINTKCNDLTVVGYCYGRGSVPYLSKFPGKNMTLRQFKSLLSRKGNFRYFFKTVSNDFGTGVVLQEITDDYKVLPMWEGKVFCVIESMDDSPGM